MCACVLACVRVCVCVCVCARARARVMPVRLLRVSTSLQAQACLSSCGGDGEVFLASVLAAGGGDYFRFAARVHLQ
jgi:hypothetical protein